MRRLIILTLVGYKRFLSPFLPSACRFHPTCSEYMREAVEIHGAGKGVWLGIKRLVRCQPFCAGGHDPVPRLESDATSPGEHAGVSAVSTKG